MAGGDDEVTAWEWLSVARRVQGELSRDHVPLLAAGVSFYGLLALFPALIAVISIYGLVADPQQVTTQLRSLTRAMPPDAAHLVVNQATSIASSSRGGLGVGLAIGIAIAAWSASSGMRWLMTALTVACDETESRSYLRQRGLALVLTLAALVLLVVVFGLTAGLPSLFRVADLGSGGKVVADLLRWPLLLAVVLAGISTLYRFGPDRDEPRWRPLSWGSGIAAAIWLLGSVAFSIYSKMAHRFDQTYGTMAGFIALMLWLFVAAFAIILGAEIDTQLDLLAHPVSPE